MQTVYLSPGNKKTGDTCSFDIPPISTCPGSTEICRSKCYANQMFAMYPALARKYERNILLTKSKDFVKTLIKHIPRQATVRIHVSGDFYSAKYARDWFKIAEKRSNCTFYAYTRSWRVNNVKMLQTIRNLQELPNVNINLSLDEDTGIPNFEGADSYRWCFMSSDDNAPTELRRNDIVFRTNHSGHKRRRKNKLAKNEAPPLPIHRIGGIVCPLERGLDIPVTCGSCRLCINKPN